MNRSYINRKMAGGLVSAGIILGNAGCIDLALIGVSAAIRSEQNRKRIEQERVIDAQRAQRDYEMREEIKSLREELRRSEYYNAGN
jgi:hypothetical protein